MQDLGEAKHTMFMCPELPAPADPVDIKIPPVLELVKAVLAVKMDTAPDRPGKQEAQDSEMTSEQKHQQRRASTQRYFPKHHPRTILIEASQLPSF